MVKVLGIWVIALLAWEMTGDAKLFAQAVAESRAEMSQNFQCLTEMPLSEPRQVRSAVKAPNPPQVIRSYRLAVAASGEYTEFHGGTKAAAMTEISNVVERLNQIYLAEMGIRFLLVTNNSAVVYTNKDSDPFTTNSPASTTLDEAQKDFDAKIGTANYDLGILLNTGTYGLAVLSSVCDSQFKGSACMGLPQPTGEIFYTYVAHEIAHQFGARHTFNDNTGFCSGNRSPQTAVEPGTGTTLLSYAGLSCGGNLQPVMDNYFHAKSIEDMATFIDDTTLCGTFVVTTNHAPNVIAGPDHVIPKLTPFKLTARGFDPEDNALTYCWEEMDLGPPQSFTAPDNGTSPLFRSFPPETNSFRSFPRMESILANTNSPGEKLPALSRVMHFRVTVRDDQKMGAKDFADTYVEVAGSFGPFRLTSHNSSDVVHGQQVIRWDVAGTSDPPINANRVNLLLSTNGGETFSIVLSTNTPNDGAKMVVFPDINCTNARIKIEAADNIFFDVNDANLTIIIAPVFTSINQDGDAVVVRWTRNAGRSYQLQAADSLENPFWQTLSVSIARDGDEMEATVPIGSGASFFRVREF